MSYHVALELSQEQVKRLKLVATANDQSVKDFVADVVLRAIDGVEKKEKGGKKTQCQEYH